MPGGTRYEAVTLREGPIQDPGFEEWADGVNNIEGDGAISLVQFRKPAIAINVLNLQCTPAISYEVFRCCMAEYSALPELDSTAMNAVGIERIVIQHGAGSEKPPSRNRGELMDRLPGSCRRSSP